MKKYLYLVSIIVMVLAYINPIHFHPWPAIQSIFLAGIAGIILLGLLALQKEKKLRIPKFSFFIIAVSLLPWIQYFFGEIFYLNTALIVSLIIILFWMVFFVGFNCSKSWILRYLSSIFLFASLISSVLAISQWLNINLSEYLRSPLNGNRPYANLNQPNQLSTLLILGVLSLFYFYEKNVLNKYISSFFCIIFLLSIALTQSRTAWVFILFFIFYFLLRRLTLKSA